MYLTLIGLTHHNRVALRGTPRELVFTSSAGPILTTATLAAIVGPCMGLERLILPKAPPPELRDDDPSPPAPDDWVDLTFAGHDRLKVLELPATSRMAPLLPRILEHLLGLASLRLDASWAAGPFNPAPMADKLTHLTLAVQESNRCLPILPGLPHLQHFTGIIDFREDDNKVPLAIWIRSSSLRVLRLQATHCDGFLIIPLTVVCPALEELVLPECRVFARLDLQCPQLSALEGPAMPPEWYNLPNPAHLTRLVLHAGGDHTAAWLAAAPRLREYRSDALCRAVSAALWASSTLTRVHVRLDGGAFPLRLPPQLEHLEVVVIDYGAIRGRCDGHWEEDADYDESENPAAGEAGELAVAGPGLRTLTIHSDSPGRRLVLNCPELEVLRLQMPSLRSFRLAEGTAPPPLHSLAIESTNPPLDLEAAPLLAFLARHGAQLRQVALPPLRSFRAWPQLAAALSGLPRLTDLRLPRRAGPLALTCPRLRVIVLTGQSGQVILHCPDLEDIRDER
ncbi:hypothetical protein PAPYR_10296 [Paratrimastix pyriformis]|uniref:Uncharacterized protein n=1 Tax=Paratrimastix pyriformis TaxID=342808 RepID=A0ABQ8UAH1_9EUKA|nr:hypothetical protein PAPYR_10296 [Paratrimastix pyriformis]